MIILFTTSFLAGILTILTPCTLPLLPVVLGGSLNNKSKFRPIIIVGSLAVSVFIFTLLLKASFNSLFVDDSLIRSLSGIIIMALGIINLYPHLWEKASQKLGLSSKSNNFLIFSSEQKGIASAILTGLALGPVFSSCSPMFGYILFAILPLSFVQGITALLLFILGMSLFLLLVSVLGQKLITKTKWASNPNGKLKKTIGIIFIVVGIAVIFRIDKSIESFLLEQPLIQNLLFNRVEQNIINSL